MMAEKVYGNPSDPEKVSIYRGQEVYRERVPVYERRVKRDADGNILWHVKGDVKIKEKMELVLVGHEEREFLEIRNANNTRSKIYDFRADPAVEAEREVEAAIEQDVKEAARIARKNGTSLSEMFARLFAGGDDAEDAPKRGRRARVEA